MPRRGIEGLCRGVCDRLRVAVTPPMACRKRCRGPLFELHAVGPKSRRGTARRGHRCRPVWQTRSLSLEGGGSQRVAHGPAAGFNLVRETMNPRQLAAADFDRSLAPGLEPLTIGRRSPTAKGRLTLRMMDLAYLLNGSAQVRPMVQHSRTTQTDRRSPDRRAPATLMDSMTAAGRAESSSMVQAMRHGHGWWEQHPERVMLEFKTVSRRFEPHSHIPLPQRTTPCSHEPSSSPVQPSS